MFNTNIIINNMDLRPETGRFHEISEHNLSKKPSRDKGAEGGFDTEIEVSDMLLTVHEENVKKCSVKQNDQHLSELEHQVVNAEVRCDTLKHQLDYLRMLCQDRFDNYLIEPDNEEMLQSPELQTSSIESNSVKILENMEENLENNFTDNNEISYVMGCGLNSTDSLISDKDFIDQPNLDSKEIALEIMYPVTNNTNSENTYNSFSPEVISYPQIPSSSKKSFKEDNTTDNDIIHVHSDCENHSILAKKIENPECCVTDFGDKSLLNSIINPSDTIADTVLEIESNNGVVNPVKTIQGILNGITDSISIISHLNVNASEPGKKECSKKHHTKKQKGQSNISKPSTLKHVEILKYFPDENVSKETLYLDNEYTMQQHEKRHHHRCCRRHRHNCQDDSLSFWSIVPAPNHSSVQMKFCSSEERIHSSHHLIPSRCKRYRRKDKSLNNFKHSTEVISQKSYPNVRICDSETKSKRYTRAETQRFIEKEPHGDSEKVNTLTRNADNGFWDKTKQQKKRTHIKNENHLLSVKDNIQINKTDNARHNNSLVPVFKSESPTFPLHSEKKQKPDDEFSVNSTIKITRRSANNEKTEIKPQISCLKHKLVDDNTPSQGLIGKIRNEPSSTFQLSCYETSPNFSTPTASSRLKQIDKPLTNLFNFRNIPFVVGTSTSRSHNLALNLQQALSIIKLRSTSLSLGSDLATEVACSMFGPQSRPSSAASYTPHKVSCPVAIAQMKNLKCQSHEDYHKFAYQNYDEKSEKFPFFSCVPGRDSISRTTVDSLCKSSTEEENFETFPQVLRKENVWEIDPDDPNTLQKKLRCTCFPTRPCTDYKKVLYQYLPNGEDTQVLNVLLPSSNKKDIKIPQSSTRSRNGIPDMQTQQKLNTLKDIEVSVIGLESPVYGQIQTHSKELRNLLMNMQKDFERLNEKYEQIQNGIEGSEVDVKKATEELMVLESELTAKENDIMVILGLHKELKSLKQQVKDLRKKASSQVLTTKPSTTLNALPREPTISIRLARLLRTIQNFQEKLLNE